MVGGARVSLINFVDPQYKCIYDVSGNGLYHVFTPIYINSWQVNGENDHKISEGMEQGFPIIFGQAHATIPGEEISFEKQVPLLQKVVRIHLPKLSTHMGLSENFGENGGKPWKTTTTQWFVITFPSKIAIWDCTPFSDTPRFAQSFCSLNLTCRCSLHRKAKAKAKQASFGALGRGFWGAQQIVQ